MMCENEWEIVIYVIWKNKGITIYLVCMYCWALSHNLEQKPCTPSDRCDKGKSISPLPAALRAVNYKVYRSRVHSWTLLVLLLISRALLIKLFCCCVYFVSGCISYKLGWHEYVALISASRMYTMFNVVQQIWNLYLIWYSQINVIIIEQ